ncbi:secreted protein [Melampsora americana]|nr:secreted protein [Melampsora americana]
MLSSQSPHKLLIIIIATLITQFAFAQATNSTRSVKCLGGFYTDTPNKNATCFDNDDQSWGCPIVKCGLDGHLWIPLKDCLHNGVAGSGTSNQQCSEYDNQGNSVYACRNMGGEIYSCHYNPLEQPYITCSECVKSVQQTGSSGGPGP